MVSKTCSGVGGGGDAHRASSQFVRFAVVGFIVSGLAVAKHTHDIGEDDTRSVVLIGIEENAQALKLVLHAENVALLGPILGDPHGKAIAKEASLAIYAEFELDLPVCGCERDSREDPTRL